MGGPRQPQRCQQRDQQRGLQSPAAEQVRRQATAISRQPEAGEPDVEELRAPAADELRQAPGSPRAQDRAIAVRAGPEEQQHCDGDCQRAGDERKIGAGLREARAPALDVHEPQEERGARDEEDLRVEEPLQRDHRQDPHGGAPDKDEQERGEQGHRERARGSGGEIVVRPDGRAQEHAREEGGHGIRQQAPDESECEPRRCEPEQGRQELARKQRLEPDGGGRAIQGSVSRGRDGLEVVGDRIPREEAGIQVARHPEDVLPRIVLHHVRAAERLCHSRQAAGRGEGQRGGVPRAPATAWRHALHGGFPVRLRAREIRLRPTRSWRGRNRAPHHGVPERS